MPHRQHHIRNAGAFHLLEHHLQNGHVADGHERLGQNLRVRREARAFASRQNDRLHTSLLKLIRTCFVAMQIAANPFDGARQSLVERDRGFPSQALDGEGMIGNQPKNFRRFRS